MTTGLLSNDIARIAVTAFNDIRARHAKRGADGLNFVSLGSGECDSKIGFFARARSSGSLSRYSPDSRSTGRDFPAD